MTVCRSWLFLYFVFVWFFTTSSIPGWTSVQFYGEHMQCAFKWSSTFRFVHTAYSLFSTTSYYSWCKHIEMLYMTSTKWHEPENLSVSRCSNSNSSFRSASTSSVRWKADRGKMRGAIAVWQSIGITGGWRGVCRRVLFGGMLNWARWKEMEG